MNRKRGRRMNQTTSAGPAAVQPPRRRARQEVAPRWLARYVLRYLAHLEHGRRPPRLPRSPRKAALATAHAGVLNVRRRASNDQTRRVVPDRLGGPRLETGIRRLALRWIGRQGSVPPAAARVIRELSGRPASLLVLALRIRFIAYREALRRDPAIRFGMWLTLAGIGTASQGLLARPLRLPWASVEVGFGVAVAVVGYYLGALRDRLEQREWSSGRVNRGAQRHRIILAAALLALPAFAILTAVRFQPPGPDTVEVALTRGGMAGGAVLATVACIVGFFLVTTFYLRRVPSTEWGQDKRNRRRILLVYAATRPAGIGCLVYSAAHLIASTYAPTVRMRIALIATAALLWPAGRECFRSPGEYIRLGVAWADPLLRRGINGLAALEEAVRIRRTRAESDPLCRPGLAAALHHLAVRAAQLGLWEQALVHAEEAVRVRRGLVLADANFQADLASSLHVLATRLRELGRREEALRNVEETVRIRALLAASDRAHRADLASSSRLQRAIQRELRGGGGIGRGVETVSLLVRDAA